MAMPEMRERSTAVWTAERVPFLSPEPMQRAMTTLAPRAIDDEADGRDIVAGGGHGFLADKASQHEDVGCGEELLEEARERDGESEDKHFAGNGTMEHVHVP